MVKVSSVDEYLNRADQWQLELTQLRRVILSCGLQETIKWGAPCYTWQDKHVVGMAGFKSYFGLWFPQGALLEDPNDVLINAQQGITQAQRQWRFKDAADIKPVVIKRYIRQAKELAASGEEIKPRRHRQVVLPEELSELFAEQATVKQAFADLAQGKQREYADYISQAKRAETRQRRFDKIVPMIRAGIGLNDQYRR